MCTWRGLAPRARWREADDAAVALDEGDAEEGFELAAEVGAEDEGFVGDGFSDELGEGIEAGAFAGAGDGADGLRIGG